MKGLRLVLGGASEGVTWLSRFSFWGAALLILAMLFAVSYEVIARYVFNRPTIWATEVSGYLLVATGFLPAAYVVHLGGHVRVDIVLVRLPPKVQQMLSVVTSLVALSYVAVLAWQGWEMAWRAHVYNWHSSSLLATPLFYPMVVIPIGAALLSLQFLVSIYRHISGPK